VKTVTKRVAWGEGSCHSAGAAPAACEFVDAGAISGTGRQPVRPKRVRSTLYAKSYDSNGRLAGTLALGIPRTTSDGPIDAQQFAITPRTAGTWPAKGQTSRVQVSARSHGPPRRVHPHVPGPLLLRRPLMRFHRPLVERLRISAARGSAITGRQKVPRPRASP